MDFNMEEATPHVGNCQWDMTFTLTLSPPGLFQYLEHLKSEWDMVSMMPCPLTNIGLPRSLPMYPQSHLEMTLRT